MSLELNWQNGLIIGAAIALFIWWIMQRIHRTFSDRCPQCGSLFQKVTYYMEPAQSVRVKGVLQGHYHMTYKFLECRRWSDHVRCHTRGRHISSVALWLKKHCKWWQLHRTQEVERLMEISGVHGPTTLGICTRKTILKIPGLSQQVIPGRRGFPKI